MSISIDKAFSVHDNALVLRSRRTSIIASNIANADTPNYKAKDMDFGLMIKKAQSGDQGFAMKTTNSQHISNHKPIQSQAVMYRNTLNPSLDGNTVDMHVEQAKFSENAIKYQSSFTFLNSKISGLLKAIKGQ
jgi:flagellar basal-body rod protein FlgB